MATTEFLPVAAASGAEVDTQIDFAGSGYQVDGFTVGPTDPAQLNKVLRQSTAFSAALANWIVNVSAVNVPDDGNRPALTTLFANAIAAAIAAAAPAARTRHDVGPTGTNARLLGTTYTNTTGETMDAVVSGTVAGSSGSTFTAYINSAVVGHESVVAAASGGAEGSIWILAIPPGATYEVTSDGMGMSRWIEIY
jgi:hypothetical protein